MTKCLLRIGIGEDLEQGENLVAETNRPLGYIAYVGLGVCLLIAALGVVLVCSGDSPGITLGGVLLIFTSLWYILIKAEFLIVTSSLSPCLSKLTFFESNFYTTPPPNSIAITIITTTIVSIIAITFAFPCNIRFCFA